MNLTSVPFIYGAFFTSRYCTILTVMDNTELCWTICNYSWLWLYCTILDHTELYWSILYYTGQYQTILKYTGLCRTILNYTELLDNAGLYWLYWTILDNTGLYWSIKDYTGLYWTILDYTGLYFTILVYSSKEFKDFNKSVTLRQTDRQIYWVTNRTRPSETCASKSDIFRYF